MTLRNVFVAICLLCTSCSSNIAQHPAAQVDPAASHGIILHLPGISGCLPIDGAMIRGLQDGGVRAEIWVYDWTEHDPGLDALHATARNQKEAQLIANLIAKQYRAHPNDPIAITSHSGGGGLAVWALEKLPPDVTIQTLLLLSPALSPTYDLTAALHHVRGKAYVFSSLGDVVVLKMGTQMFGTIDGVKTAAAGCVGFTRPSTADPVEYQKLICFPYEDSWMQYGDWGNHIGDMDRRFAKAILAPLLEHGIVPATQPVVDPATNSQARQ